MAVLLLQGLFTESVLNALVQLGAVGLLALAIVLLFRGGNLIVIRFLDIVERLTVAIEKIEATGGRQLSTLEDVVMSNEKVVTITAETKNANLALIEEIKQSRSTNEEQKLAIINAVTEAKNSIEANIVQIDSRAQLAAIETLLLEVKMLVTKALNEPNKPGESAP